MSIKSDEITTRVATITKRLSTQITSQHIIAVLVDLSKRVPALKTSTSGTIATGAGTISKPSDFVSLDHLDMDNGIILDDITFDEYLRGTKTGVAERGDTLYINPAPTAGKSYTLYYTKTPDESVTPIAFGEAFRMAIVYGVAEQVFRDYGLSDKADEHLRMYEREVSKLQGDYVEAPNPGPISRIA
jgi:hypothetical protein